jgi:hypothetical protein
MQNIGNEHGFLNKELEVHFAVVGMYLNYRLSKSQPMKPLKQQNLNGNTLIFIVSVSFKQTLLNV